MKVATAFVEFVGNIDRVDESLNLIPGKAEPIAKKVGALFSANITAGIAATGGMLTTVGGAALELAKPIEHAQASVKAAFDSTHANMAAYKGKFEEVIATGEKYGHSSADTMETIAKLTLALGSPEKAFAAYNDVTALAAKNNSTLSEGADKMIGVYSGKGAKTLASVNIHLKDNAIILADVTKATKAHDAATTGLSKAQDALSQLEARDAGVKKLSIGQQQQLAAAHKAVSDAQAKSAATAAELQKATEAANGVSKDGAKLIHEWAQGYHGADDQAATFDGRIKGLTTKFGDLAGEVGGKAGPVLVAAGPAMMTLGGILQAVTMFTGAHKAAVVADTVATEASTSVGLLSRIGMAAGAVVTGIMTAAQWALNVALDANPIGLVVIAIAALIGGFVLAYQHVSWFRDGVNWLWKEIQMLWHWIVGGSPGLVPAFQQLMSIIGTVIRIALTPMRLEFELLSTIIGKVWDILKGFADFIGNVFTTMLRNVTGPLGQVGDLLQVFNPHKKGSPSLVENVISGTDIIKSRYTALSGMQIASPSVGGIGAGNMPSLASALSGPGGGVAGGGVAGGGQAGGGVHIENMPVTVVNPRTELDLVRAMETANYLATLKARGIAPPPRATT